MIQKLTSWRERLRRFKSKGIKTVLWGSGSKAVSFLTTSNIDREIEYVIDINPHRHNTYMAKSGHPIVAPNFLREYKPDVVIVMNEVYKEEIRKYLLDMELSPRLLTLEP